jgi:hypothetical protein
MDDKICFSIVTGRRDVEALLASRGLSGAWS